MNEKIREPIQVIGRDPVLTTKIMQMIAERAEKQRRYNCRKNAVLRVFGGPIKVWQVFIRWLHSWS